MGFFIPYSLPLVTMQNLENILVIDIETVPSEPTFADLDERWQALWTKKAKTIAKDLTPEEAYERAGIYAEFGKIICIGLGVYYYQNRKLHLRVKSIEAHNEKELLIEFGAFLKKHYNKKDQLLAAHNGKEFDYPYLCRRMMINQLKLPKILNLSGKKPWEVQHLDTMQLWKQGDYKNYTSLELLAAAFNIETPKDDIDGSQVKSVYYEENNLDRIAQYCKKDVVTTAKILSLMQNNEAVSSVELK